MSTTATNQIMEQEAQALAELLVSGERCALVIVMVAEPHDDDSIAVSVGHGVAGDTRGLHLRGFVAATERKLEWLHDKLKRKD
ncbi:MAG: hypothetical protein ACOY45_01765 [Pseudomonadota bacterium]